jgi:hypothetical protein
MNNSFTNINFWQSEILIPTRHESSAAYRYGFQVQEMDNEIVGSGNHLSFGDYGYSPRLGRR